MPKVRINRSDRKLPSRTSDPKASEISPDLQVARALGSRGDALFKIGLEGLARDKIARDSAYVARANIESDNRIQALSNQLRQNPDPRGHTQRFIDGAEKIYAETIKQAPSQSAKRSIESQLAGIIFILF